MQFIAKWGIYVFPKRFSEPEIRYESEPLRFEKDSVRAAKTHVTRAVKADPNMQTLKEDKHGFGPYPPDWDAWSETANYMHQDGVRYSCRLSRSEYESSEKDAAYSSTAIQAQIYLHWRAENEDDD